MSRWVRDARAGVAATCVLTVCMDLGREAGWTDADVVALTQRTLCLPSRREAWAIHLSGGALLGVAYAALFKTDSARRSAPVLGMLQGLMTGAVLRVRPKGWIVPVLAYAAFGGMLALLEEHG